MVEEKYVRNICLFFFLTIIFLLSSIKRGNGLSQFQKEKPDKQTYTSETQLSDTLVNWKEITSVSDLRQTYPNRLQVLFESLNLDHVGLSRVKTFLQKEDTIAAANALLDYYRQSDTGSWLQRKHKITQLDVLNKEAQRMLKDTISVRRGPVSIPRLDDSGINWNYTGPNHDDEFGYNLNRQHYFLILLHAWQETKNPDYANKLDQFIRDWTIHNPLPSRGDSIYKVLNTSTDELDWRDIGEVRWRPMEAGNRLGRVWPQVFYGFQQADGFTPAGRLLMLSSLYNHAQYIYQYHSTHHNHALMEMNGLALVGLVFPEFKNSHKWFQQAKNKMLSEMKYLVYPDGISKELTSSYQIVALKAFERFVSNSKKAGRKVNPTFQKYLEKMYNYLAYAMRPDGYQPLNNDSDREDLRPRVLKAADKYNRPDWRWVATSGEEGQKPQGLPSRTFPWAGTHIMRSGWDQNAHWSFFDTGPFGTAHQHSDMLHLSVAAYGQDLLVDGGRYIYENYWSFDPTTWRGYFRSSFSHNVILVDGHGQTSEQNRADAPLQEGKEYINKPAFDYARGIYAGGYAQVEGKAEHTRAVLYVWDKYWVVVDRIATDRPRELQVLWHYAPDLQVQQEGTAMVSTNTEGANLRITPVGGQNWSTQIIKGQTKPVIQGWYSAEYGKKVPNPTAIYKANIDGDAIFAWVLTPAKGVVQSVKVTLVETDNREVQINIKEVKEEDHTKLIIPLSKAGFPALRGR